ncbi:MAG TPA: AsmA-like C-terminal region-containing protein [Vicinamibacterales bacterium]|nr:AsmA-like C-terminal region-containing protein [Vicinamibacterales bacterium]
MRRSVVISLVLLVALAAIIAVAAVAVAPLSEDRAREKLVASLSEHLDAQVELKELHLQTLPSLRAEGRGLTIRHRGRTDVPPLITIAHFSAEAGLLTFWRHHISRVTIDGLDIAIPPDRNDDARPRKDVDEEPAGAPSLRQPDRAEAIARALIVDHLYSMNARLTIIPSKPGKAPRVWNIHDLHMTSVAAGTAMPFEATLTNAVPPGEIVTRGSFGPWAPDEPGDTPLDGLFTFAHADLGVFNGISGTLSARGQFGGKLDRIDVHGETDTPEFRIVKTGGQPVPLHATYHTIVDGTNGNTILDEIDATFLNTRLVAKGTVLGNPTKHGRTTTLDVSIDRGRLEDLLRLAVNAPKPPMTGSLRLKTSFVLPPGDVDVVNKLRLDGHFTLAGARFMSDTVQRKIAELSRRGRGHPDDVQDPAHVLSKFDGRFKLSGGTLQIPDVTFDVPGALVQLAGNYQLEREDMNFKGTLFMDAKISDTTTGIKHVLLKAIDPLFKRDGGGSAIPIKITGTRANPSFGLDKGRIFSHDTSAN